MSAAPRSGQLLDSFGRVHSDLRISVTDRCNIRCFYCMPEEGAEFAPRVSLLSFAEIERFVQAALPLGITKIRLTGGEPLLRPRLYRTDRGFVRANRSARPCADDKRGAAGGKRAKLCSMPDCGG